MNGLQNTFGRESLLSKSLLDLIEYFGMARVCLLQHVLQRQICGTQPVTEMLGKYPASI
jgi:hypothetical protein